MGWLITLGVLTLLAILPLGVRVRYDSDGARVAVILGPVKITLYPRPPKDKKEKKIQKEKKAAPAKDTPAPAQTPGNPPPPAPAKAPKAEKTGGSLLDFLPLVKELFRFLDVFRRKLRVDYLQLQLTLASSDPCDLAVNYGRAWTAVGNLLPRLERIFVIRKREIDVSCDFTGTQTLVIAGLDITITLGRLLAAVVVFAVRALIQYLKIMKKRKGGAEK